MGYSVLGGLGCGICYIGPQISFFRWFPEVPRELIAALSFSGFAIGSLIFIPVANSLAKIPYLSTFPDILFIATSTFISVSIACCSFFCAAPNSKLLEEFTTESCVEMDVQLIEDPETRSVFKLPRLFYTLKQVRFSRDFICTVVAFNCAIVPGLLAVPTFFQGMMLVNLNANQDETELVGWSKILFEIFFASAFIGNLLGGIISWSCFDMKMSVSMVLIFHLVYYATTTFVFDVSDLTLGADVWLPIVLEGLSYGFITGSMYGYLKREYGAYLSTVLQGYVYLLLPFFMAVIGPVMLSYLNSPLQFSNMVRATYLTLSVVGLVFIICVNVDPLRKMINKLTNVDEFSYFVVPAFFGYDFEVSRYRVKMFSKEERLLQVLMLLKRGGSDYLMEDIPSSRSEIRWYYWSICEGLSSILISVPVICALMFNTPIFALLEILKLSNNATKTCSTVISNQALLKSDIQRFLAYVFIGALITLALIMGVATVNLRALLGPLRRTTRRMIDTESFVFDEEPATSNTSCSSILELSVLNTQTETLRKSLYLFGIFVPEIIVRQALRDRQYRRPYGERRCVTILFLDIVPLSSSLEKLSDVELRSVFSKVFSELATVVDQHHGVIAEILEDGMLAFWNSLEDNPNHASEAFRCSLALEQTVNELREFLTTENGFPSLKSYTGIHTGWVTSGIVGAKNRMKFGCVGDAMNVASRLKGLCKVYEVGIIVSQNSVSSNFSGGDFLLRPLDTVRVVGKSIPTKIFQLVCETSKVDDSTKNMVETYSSALTGFQSGKFTATIKLLEKSSLHDQANSLLRNRATMALNEFGDDNPNWSGGIMDYKTK